MKNLIVFTIDERYIEPFVVAIESFSVFNDVNKYEIALVHSCISDQNIKKIKNYMDNRNISFIVVKIDDVFKDIEVGYHFNSVIFYRLLLPSIFDKYKKLLYLDSDILFTDSIDELFDIELDSNILAAIPRHEYFDIPKHIQDKTSKYFASGLLLINVDEFIKSEVYKKCLEFLKNEKYEMPDQDALNSVVSKWLELDLKYGVETDFLKTSNKELQGKIQNPKIIQFSGSSKPWYFRNKHPYKNLYWKYLRMTPFKRYIPEDLTALNVIKSMVPKKIKDMIKFK